MTTTNPANPARWHEEKLRRSRWLIADGLRSATPAQARECQRAIAGIDAALAAFGYEQQAAQEAA